MNLPQSQAPDGIIPDLRRVAFDRLAQQDDDSVLANSAALYRQRFRESGVQSNDFNNFIAKRAAQD